MSLQVLPSREVELNPVSNLFHKGHRTMQHFMPGSVSLRQLSPKESGECSRVTLLLMNLSGVRHRVRAKNDEAPFRLATDKPARLLVPIKVAALKIAVLMCNSSPQISAKTHMLCPNSDFRLP